MYGKITFLFLFFMFLFHSSLNQALLYTAFTKITKSWVASSTPRLVATSWGPRIVRFIFVCKRRDVNSCSPQGDWDGEITPVTLVSSHSALYQTATPTLGVPVRWLSPGVSCYSSRLQNCLHISLLFCFSAIRIGTSHRLGLKE